MRAAAIFGLGSSTRQLRPFQKDSRAHWQIGLPSSSSEADAILIFGGDGTVHRHLGQLVKLNLPVLVVPAGSGNDFARSLGLYHVRNSLSAWQEFEARAGNVRTIDLGVITPLAMSNQAANSAPEASLPGSAPHSVLTVPHYFCCVAGCGLDAGIARRANRFPRWLRAHGGYALSLPGALRRFAPASLRILLPDPGNPDEFAIHTASPTVLLACANTSAYGGGMRIAPHARLDDARLEICRVRQISKLKLLCLFPTVYFGRHLGVPEVDYFQAERLRLETEQPWDLYADGEFVCQTPVEVSVAPAILRVVVPRNHD
jgi:diacylglycerol kinase (ATP)